MKLPRKKPVPTSVLRRFVKYYALVQRLRQDRTEWVSSQTIADSLGLTSSTVRQDLLYLDFSGISKRGYFTEGLERAMALALGADKGVKVVIVGAGNLGRALAMHGALADRGFEICGVFDSDPKALGRRMGRVTVSPMEELPTVVHERNVDIGVITVPASSAQSVADQLILCGIRGLLNLAHVHLRVPRSVAVVDARLLASLQELWYAIQVNPYGVRRRRAGRPGMPPGVTS